MRHLSLIIPAAILAGASSILAGPVADFETSFRDMYGTYRVALFQTNTGAQEPSQEAIAVLDAQWAALVEVYSQTPPPQYEDDPLWGQTLSNVTSYLAAASDQITEGQLAEAHETLEGVRDEISGLHDRNGIEIFSDRMNAYHAEMEHILETDMTQLDDGSIQLLRERAAVLSYLADDLMQVPPAEAEGNPEFSGLAGAFEASVDAFVDAARAGDPVGLQNAVGNLKVPYSKFFLKFG